MMTIKLIHIYLSDKDDDNDHDHENGLYWRRQGGPATETTMRRRKNNANKKQSQSARANNGPCTCLAWPVEPLDVYMFYGWHLLSSDADIQR